METQVQTTPTKEKNSSPQPMKITGADAVIRSLLHEDVDTIFGYVGGAIMPIYDALFDHKENVKHHMVRHEQGAIHAAQGYARATRKTGVVFATSGPGATNLITGLADAMLDSTPLVCITGQVPSALLGTDAFQETDILSMSMPATKWNFQITRAEEIPEALAKAFYFANSGRPGPVLIDITKDAQFAEIDYVYEKINKVRSYIPYPKINSQDIADAAKLINEAKQPLLLVGQGVILSGAEKELYKFVEKTGIPVAWTLLGSSAFPNQHELSVGMLGMHGNYGPNKATNECDLLIGLGMRFDDRVTGNLQTYAKQAKVLHIELDPAEINKNVKADVAVNADAKQALMDLIHEVEEKRYPEWYKVFDNYKKIEHDKVIENDVTTRPGHQIKMGEVIHRISELTKGEAVVVTDVGQHQMSAARYYMNEPGSNLITSGGLGTMGFGLPAAIGAKIALGDKKEVITFIGDGGFQMTVQELGTIMESGAAVKIVLLNNGYLGMVRQWQDLFFEKRYSMVELTNPDFIKLSESYGIKARQISAHEDLEDGLNEMLQSKEAFLLEVIVEKEENVFPMVPAGATVSEMRLE